MNTINNTWRLKKWEIENFDQKTINKNKKVRMNIPISYKL